MWALVAAANLESSWYFMPKAPTMAPMQRTMMYFMMIYLHATPHRVGCWSRMSPVMRLEHPLHQAVGHHLTYGDGVGVILTLVHVDVQPGILRFADMYPVERT